MYSRLSGLSTNKSTQKPKRARLCLGAFFLLGFLSACGTPQQTLEIRQNPPDITRQRELTSTAFFPQTDYHCGPAALASIIQHHKIIASPEDIARLVYTPGLKGSLQIEMIAASRQFDLLPVKLDGRLESLLREIDAGNPVLVLQNLGLAAYPFWHYAVVIGYDLDSQSIILRSGTEKRLVRPFDNFERTWQRAEHWGLVIVPPDKVPATANAEAYLNTIIDLEQSGRLTSAYQAYQQAAKHWPDNLIAYMGIGNTAFDLGKYAVSASAYQQLLAISPNAAAAWNNLAYALAKQGKKQSSLAAIDKAIQLAPDNINFQHSHDELKQLLGID